jgi:AcrR family transcriptional regulator
LTVPEHHVILRTVLVEPTRDRRAERHEATRVEILEAAWAQGRAEGLAALSLRDVAKAVGMRAPSLYSYFDSKNAIYDAMYAQGAREFVDREPVVGLEPTGDLARDLKIVARSFLDFCTADSARYTLLFQRTIPGFEPSAESFQISVESLDRLRRFLAAAGVPDERAVDLYTAMVTGLADQQISNDPGGDRWTRLVDEAVDMFVAHVTNPSRRAGA